MHNIQSVYELGHECSKVMSSADTLLILLEVVLTRGKLFLLRTVFGSPKKTASL